MSVAGRQKVNNRHDDSRDRSTFEQFLREYPYIRIAAGLDFDQSGGGIRIKGSKTGLAGSNITPGVFIYQLVDDQISLLSAPEGDDLGLITNTIISQ